MASTPTFADGLLLGAGILASIVILSCGVAYAWKKIVPQHRRRRLALRLGLRQVQRATASSTKGSSSSSSRGDHAPGTPLSRTTSRTISIASSNASFDRALSKTKATLSGVASKIFESRRKLVLVDDKDAHVAALRADIERLGPVRMPSLSVPPFALSSMELSDDEDENDEDISDALSDGSGSSDGFSLSCEVVVVKNKMKPPAAAAEPPATSAPMPAPESFGGKVLASMDAAWGEGAGIMEPERQGHGAGGGAGGAKGKPSKRSWFGGKRSSAAAANDDDDDDDDGFARCSLPRFAWDVESAEPPFPVRSVSMQPQDTMAGGAADEASEQGVRSQSLPVGKQKKSSRDRLGDSLLSLSRNSPDAFAKKMGIVLNKARSGGVSAASSSSTTTPSSAPIIQLAAPLSENDQTALRACAELYESEHSYACDVLLTLHYFRDRMRGCLKPDEVKTIFSNLEALSRLSRELLREMQKPGDPILVVAAAFTRLSHFLKLFGFFCENYDLSVSELVKLKGEVKGLRNFLSRQAKRKECRALTLESFLIKPVQRIAKYHLFFDRLLRLQHEGVPPMLGGRGTLGSGGGDPERHAKAREALQAAAKSVALVTSHVNGKAAAMSRKAHTLLGQLGSAWLQLLDPSVQLMLEAPCTVTASTTSISSSSSSSAHDDAHDGHTQGGGGGSLPCTAYLFTDLLLICRASDHEPSGGAGGGAAAAAAGEAYLLAPLSRIDVAAREDVAHAARGRWRGTAMDVMAAQRLAGSVEASVRSSRAQSNASAISTPPRRSGGGGGGGGATAVSDSPATALRKIRSRLASVVQVVGSAAANAIAQERSRTLVLRIRADDDDELADSLTLTFDGTGAMERVKADLASAKDALASHVRPAQAAHRQRPGGLAEASTTERGMAMRDLVITTLSAALREDRQAGIERMDGDDHRRNKPGGAPPPPPPPPRGPERSMSWTSLRRGRSSFGPPSSPSRRPAASTSLQRAVDKIIALQQAQLVARNSKRADDDGDRV